MRRAVLAAIFILPACGFRPVHAPGGPGDHLQGQVAVIAPQTPAGFRLRQQLQAVLGQPAAPAYDLTVAIAETRENAAITPDGDITRYTLVGTADWTLVATASETATASGSVSAFASYSATGSTVATQTAEANARDRLSTALADLILADLTLAAPR